MLGQLVVVGLLLSLVVAPVVGLTVGGPSNVASGVVGQQQDEPLEGGGGGGGTSGTPTETDTPTPTETDTPTPTETDTPTSTPGDGPNDTDGSGESDDGGNGSTGGGDTGDESATDLRSIDVGETRSGEIDADDPRVSAYDGYHEPVTFQGTAGDTVTVEMRSGGDSYLYLVGPDGTVLAENDDGGVGLNATIGRETLPETGQYRIIAASFFTDDTLSYELSLTETQPGTDLDSIAFGETKTGEVDSGDETGFSEVTETVTFEGTQGDRVRATVETDVDNLEIAGIETTAGVSLEPVRDEGSLAYETVLPSDGSYTVSVATPQTDLPASYDLTLRNPGEVGPADGDLRSIALGETKTGLVDSTDPQTAQVAFYEPVEFEGTDGQTVQITLDARVADAFPRFEVRSPDGNQLETTDLSEDGGTVTGTVELPSDGTYTVRPSLGEGELGAYDLTVALADGSTGAPPTASVDAFTIGDTAFLDATASDATGSVSYEWAFGDGTTATGQAVTHAYDADGSYDVELTVSNGSGTDTTSASVDVAAGEPASVCQNAENRPPGLFEPFEKSTVVAACSGLPTVIAPAPTAEGRSLVIGNTTFLDGSVSTATGEVSYEWAFGDGTTATGKSVSHTYDSDGTYQVLLTVSNETGTDTATTVVNVARADVSPVCDDATRLTTGILDAFSEGSVRTACADARAAADQRLVPDFELSSDPVVGESVEFDAGPTTAEGTVRSYEWALGNGESATGETATVTYEEAGSYTVELTVTDEQGNSDTITRSVVVGASAGRIVVDDDGGPDAAFRRLLPALQAVSDDGTVVVRPGTYNGTGTVETSVGEIESGPGVLLNGNVTVAAPDGATLTSEGTSGIADDGFRVAASNAEPTIVGFTVRGFDDGIDARDGSDLTVSGVTVENAEVGVNLLRSDGSVSLSDVTVRDPSETGVRADGFAGDLELVDVTVDGAGGAGVRATQLAATGTLTATGLRISDSGGDGVTLAGAVGSWELDGARVEGAGDAGVDAAATTGDWEIRGSTFTGNDVVDVNALDADGVWRIHRTEFEDAAGIDARGASPGGTARRNWWGTPDGPADGTCSGAVLCGNPLGEPVSPAATGLTATVSDGDEATPFPGTTVYLYQKQPLSVEDRSITTADALASEAGREYYDDSDGEITLPFDGVEVSQTADRVVRTGPEGIVRYTGLEAGEYCLLVAPPNRSPRDVKTQCIAVESGDVTSTTVTHTDTTRFDHMTDEVSAFRFASRNRRTDALRRAYNAHIQTGTVLEEGDPVPGVDSLANTFLDSVIAGVAADPKKGGGTKSPRQAAKSVFTEFATSVAKSSATTVTANQIKERYGALVAGAVTNDDAEEYKTYTQQFENNEWLTSFPYGDVQKAGDEYRDLSTAVEAERLIGETSDRFAELRSRNVDVCSLPNPPRGCVFRDALTSEDDGQSLPGGGSGPNYDPAAMEDVLETQRDAIAGEWVANGLVVTPDGAVYTVNQSAGARASHRRAYQNFQGSQGAKKLSSFVSRIGGTITDVSVATKNPYGFAVGTGVEAVGTTGKVLYTIEREKARFATVQRFFKTHLYAMHDVDNVGNVNGDVRQWLSSEYRDPSVGGVDGRIETAPTFSEDENGVQVVDANRPLEENTNVDIKTRYVDERRISVRNTGTEPAPVRVVSVATYRSDRSDFSTYGQATTVPASSESAATLDPGETLTEDTTLTLSEPIGDPFRVYFQHTLLLMEGKVVDTATDHTFFDIRDLDCERGGRQGNVDCADPDGRTGYGRDEADSPDPVPPETAASGTLRVRRPNVALTTASTESGLAMAQESFTDDRPEVRQLFDTNLTAEDGRVTESLSTGPETHSLSVLVVSPTGAETSLQLTDAAGRTAGRDPVTGTVTTDIPNATVSGTGEMVQSVRIENVSRRDIGVTVAGNATGQDSAPVEVLAVTTPDRPAVMGLVPSAVDIEATPGADRRGSIRVVESGGQESLGAVEATAGELTNNAGTALPGTVAAVGPDGTVGVGGAASVNLTVSVPVDAAVPEGEPTRFTGPVTVESENGGSLDGRASVIVLDSDVSGARLVSASRGVTGVRLDNATADGTVDGDGRPVAAFDVFVRGEGNVTLRLPTDASSGPLNAFTAAEGDTPRYDVDSSSVNATVTLSDGEHRLVFTRPPDSPGTSGATGDSDSAGDSSSAGDSDAAGDVGTVTGESDGTDGPATATRATDTTTATVPPTTEASGEQTTAANESVPTVTAETPARPAADIETTADGPGFGLSVAVFAALAAALLCYRRRA
ncbi:PKD domain-containing protein [Halorientalis sp.]|uniref:PKD domain-containing protein n=1 Tax=Halorientalis sp. TaxID=1931229 RepID=UPI00263810BB|nr:PKD domain-containing protein [Halorientalis sp.]